MNVDEFEKTLLKDIEVKALTLLKEKAINAEGLAKLYCPVDLGVLRASISHYIERKGDTIIAHIGSPLEYAPYVEYGTGIYAKDGLGRQTPWVYFNEKLQRYIKTEGQHPKLFLNKAIEKVKSEFR